MKQCELEKLVTEIKEAHEAGFLTEADRGWELGGNHDILVARTKQILPKCRKVANYISEKYDIRVDIHGMGQGYETVFRIFIPNDLDLKEAMVILPWPFYKRPF